MIKERIKTYAKSHKLMLCAVTYLLCSALLSLTIFLRIFFLPIEPIKYANTILYLSFYYLLSSLAGSIILIDIWFSSSDRLKNAGEKTKKVWFIAIFCTIILCQMTLVFLKILPDFISLVLFMPIATALYIVQFKHKRHLACKKITALLALLISFCTLMPPLTAYLCDSTVVSQISAMSPSEKSSYISDLIARTTFTPPAWFIYASFLRLDNFQVYLMSGIGACGEMARSTSDFLNQSGLVSRTVDLPGEDHVFVEVNLNQTWYVLDPGYYHGEILTREQRAERRLIEMGAVSYVIADGRSTFIDLTNNYVPTDNITLQVLNNGKSVEDAQVYLTHTFMGQTWRLPNASEFFCTDNNGTVLIRLGSLNYSSNAGKVDNFFKVYVNGIDTGKTVSSTGNQTQLLSIDISSLH